MKRTKMLTCLLLALVMALSFALTACNDQSATTGAPDPKPSQTQPTTGQKPTDPAVKLEISVIPAEMESYAGEDIDLMLGVTVNDENATLRISDDNDFDKDTPGTYTITYEATLGETKVTATRTIIVNKALSNIALEVRENILGENKWQGKLLSFPHAMFVELNESAALPKQSGVFYNASNGDIVLSIEGGYGCSAVIDGNGVVLEGRDGANSKLVNAQNPSRSSSSVTTLTIGGESVSVASAFAKEMTIPAGGYAIVVQASEFGTTADSDGRSFMNYNVIGQIGNVVRLFWVDTDETLTPYINQKPTVSGNNKVLLQLGDATFHFETAILAGLVVKDDAGTLETKDDVTIEEITIVDDGGFNANVAGVYTVTLSVTDGELTTEFTREIEVKSEGIGTITIGENKMNIALDYVVVDQELSGIGNYAFIIYTSNYTGTIGFANGYGVAMILDEYGTVVRIYDGASAKYFDAEHDGVKDGTCTETGYANEAFASLQPGETLIIAPNSTANNAEGGSRAFLYSNRTVGAIVSGLGLNFKTTSVTITVDDSSLTVEEGSWLYNSEITSLGTAENYSGNFSMIIYDKNYTGTFTTNQHGCAIVLDQYGTLIKVYDGANLGYWTVDGKAASVHFGVGDYATVAFAELQEGETLIIFPHAPNVNDNQARKWALNLRGAAAGSKSYMGLTATLTGFTFEEKPAEETKDKTITIDDSSLTIEEGGWLYNTEVTSLGTAENYSGNFSMIIYDKNYTGTFTTNQHGCAIVLDQYGTLIKVYDGANLGYWTVDGKAASVHFGVGDYATVAFAELQEGETLIIFPHAPNINDNQARKWALNLRGAAAGSKSYMGLTATLTGFTFEKKEN